MRATLPDAPIDVFVLMCRIFSDGNFPAAMASEMALAPSGPNFRLLLKSSSVIKGSEVVLRPCRTYRQALLK